MSAIVNVYKVLWHWVDNTSNKPTAQPELSYVVGTASDEKSLATILNNNSRNKNNAAIKVINVEQHITGAYS